MNGSWDWMTPAASGAEERGRRKTWDETGPKTDTPRDSDLFGGFFFGVDLPVGQGLGSGSDIGNVGVDSLGRSGATRCGFGAIREARGLIVALGDAGLLPLALIRRWS